MRAVPVARVASVARERGAAAVEFALVVPILIALVMGIIDYGLYFSDRLAVTQGIREAARDAVVSETPACGTAPNLTCLAVRTRDGMGVVGGQSEVLVRIVGTDEWKEGNSLLICTVVAEDGLTGLTPMPDLIRDSVQMRLEHDVLTSSAAPGQTAAAPPGGWSWCGA